MHYYDGPVKPLNLLEQDLKNLQNELQIIDEDAKTIRNNMKGFGYAEQAKLKSKLQQFKLDRKLIKEEIKEIQKQINKQRAAMGEANDWKNKTSDMIAKRISNVR